ncbi:hypothetical protein CVU37_12095 [candidate division BRC1 bacterium HGW-BRC1-1]|jgi:serine phosphatase RsbU (regulator of sigma subunit)/pSer/pThr/pTyr-binding forkhead associated (FHA) protein|nr:MAG: hypothetical protein CVU37_12095 [candidate division BRC1 bacterium HGW-BRC1-1]
MPRLIVESGADAGMVYILRDEAVTLGRSASCTIQMADKRASRHHTVLRMQRNSYVAEDLGSKNGTLLNEDPLVGRVLLKSGDRLQVGDTVLVFEREHDSDSFNAVDVSGSGRVRMVKEEISASREERRIESSTGAGVMPESVEAGVLRDPFERLKVLYQVADSIRSILNTEELLEHILDILWRVVKPTRGVILLVDQVENVLEPVVVRSNSGDTEEITISQGIVERAMSEQVAILVSDAVSDLRFSANESVALSRIRSAICAPLVVKEEVLGVIYVDTQELDLVSYTNDELELISGIANQAALAISNARLYQQSLHQQALDRELEIARTIQTNLLPKSFPHTPGVEMAAMSLPARKVGGDFYDFIRLEDGRIAIVVADVSGKGVAAAILTATIRASVRMETHLGGRHGVAGVVGAVNRWTCRDASNNMFATMFYGVLNPGDMSFEFTNAGHVYPVIFRANGDIIPLEAGGCFLGIMEMVDYQSDFVTFAPGDMLVIYTDGITDSHNADDEVFGLDRLMEVARNNRGKSAVEVRDSIHTATLQFRGQHEQFDDLTLLVAKF